MGGMRNRNLSLWPETNNSAAGRGNTTEQSGSAGTAGQPGGWRRLPAPCSARELDSAAVNNSELNTRVNALARADGNSASGSGAEKQPVRHAAGCVFNGESAVAA